MKVQLNKNTTVTVEEGLTKFRTTRKQKEDLIVLRNDKTYSVNIQTKRQFLLSRFLILFAIGLLGGLGHYLYDTQFLGYNPNPPIIGAIVAVFTIVGLVISFVKQRVFTVIMDDRARYKSFVIPIDKDVNQEELEQLIDILSILPVEPKPESKPITPFVESLLEDMPEPTPPPEEETTEEPVVEDIVEPVKVEPEDEEPEDIVDDTPVQEEPTEEKPVEDNTEEPEPEPEVSIPEGVIETLVHVEGNEDEVPTHEELVKEDAKVEDVEPEPEVESEPHTDEEITAMDLPSEEELTPEPEQDEPQQEEHREELDQPKEVIIEHLDITKELYKYTVAQLRDIAKSQGMKNYTKYRKADLIDFMIEHDVELPNK